MAIDPNSLNDPKDIRNLMENARRKGVTDLVQKCRVRLIELGGKDIDDPLTKRLWQAVTAYEEILERKHNKAQPASYTRRKIRDKGVRETLIDWALDSKIKPGFEALVNDGLAEFTGEYIVIEFAYLFPEEAVNAAKRKLATVGFDIKNIETKH